MDGGFGKGASQRNVLGGELGVCSANPVTGFFRTGCCHTGPGDLGSHTVCVRVTGKFLEYSLSVGNDLSTPRPEFDFAGLRPGDRWCLCAARWEQARMAGSAPEVVLEATNAAALAVCSLEDLKAHAAGG